MKFVFCFFSTLIFMSTSQAQFNNWERDLRGGLGFSGAGGGGDIAVPRPPIIPAPNEPSSELIDIFELALQATNGGCNVFEDTHSYACAKWNFDGNATFPLFDMDWNSLQGEWVVVTYADSPENKSPGVFSMLKNPDRPSQPMGVMNVKSNTPMGSVIVSDRQLTFLNWKKTGQVLATVQATFNQNDSRTVSFTAMSNGRDANLIGFTCRDFNRKNNHHILCAWDVSVDNGQTWRHRGFFGFLRLEAWNSFRRTIPN